MRCGSCWREWNSCPTIIKESLIGQPKKSILTTYCRIPHKSAVYAGFSYLKVAIKIGGDHYGSSHPRFSDFEALLERLAGYFFILVECVGVDVQGGGWLRVAQQAGYRGYVCAVGD